MVRGASFSASPAEMTPARPGRPRDVTRAGRKSGGDAQIRKRQETVRDEGKGGETKTTGGQDCLAFAASVGARRNELSTKWSPNKCLRDIEFVQRCFLLQGRRMRAVPCTVHSIEYATVHLLLCTYDFSTKRLRLTVGA